MSKNLPAINLVPEKCQVIASDPMSIVRSPCDNPAIVATKLATFQGHNESQSGHK